METSVLQKNPLFNGFSIREIEDILQRIPHRIKQYPEGSVIALSGEPVDRLMILISGKAIGEMVDFSGRIIKIEDIPAPGALASAFMFGGNNNFPVNVSAVEDTNMLIIYKADFLKLMRHNDRILLNFLDMISNRSQFLSEKIKFLNFKTIKGKLAQYILKKCSEEGGTFVLARTQSDLADFFGVARPSVARILAELEREGLIYLKYRKITIIDREGLEEISGFREK